MALLLVVTSGHWHHERNQVLQFVTPGVQTQVHPERASALGRNRPPVPRQGVLRIVEKLNILLSNLFIELHRNIYREK